MWIITFYYKIRNVGSLLFHIMFILFVYKIRTKTRIDTKLCPYLYLVKLLLSVLYCNFLL